MFTILLKTPHGWTTNLGSGENSWDTEASAETACADLRQLDDTWADAELKIVLTEDLGRYELIA